MENLPKKLSSREFKELFLREKGIYEMEFLALG
jgi:hypothetical protein